MNLTIKNELSCTSTLPHDFMAYTEPVLHTFYFHNMVINQLAQLQEKLQFCTVALLLVHVLNADESPELA